MKPHTVNLKPYLSIMVLALIHVHVLLHLSLVKVVISHIRNDYEQLPTVFWTVQWFVDVYLHIFLPNPTFYLLNLITRVSLSILSAQKTRSILWGEREPRVFFRGRDSNKARLELVKQHRRNTELFDVGITNWFFFPYDEEVYGPKMKSVSFHDFFKVR